MSGISLTSSMRSNLLSLQGTSKLMDLTQQRLSTGKKVNSAIDNPSNFYTAQSLNNRAKDLDALLDSMGQAISTIKAASEAMESGLGLLDQAASIAEQAISSGAKPMSDKVRLEDNVEELKAKGYTVVDKNTTISQLNALLQTNDAKIVLADDVTFSSAIDIKGNNVTINGGGHKLTTNSNMTIFGSGATITNVEIERASTSGTIINTVADTSVNYNIDNVRLINNASGENVGIQANATGKINNVSIEFGNLDNKSTVGVQVKSDVDISGLSVKLTGTESLNVGVYALSGEANISSMSVSSIGNVGYGVLEKGGKVLGVDKVSSEKVEYEDGKENTATIIDALGSDSAAAKAASYYVGGVGDNDFGQGQWYLPTMSELVEMYGYDETFDGSSSSTGSKAGEGIAAIKNALQVLKNEKGVDADTLSDNLWSSSERSDRKAWRLNFSTGARYASNKSQASSVRSFNLVENVYDPNSENTPKIGDIMYTDKTWSSVDNYDVSKTIAGVITSPDNGSVKVMSIKNVATGVTWGDNTTNIANLEDISPDKIYASVMYDKYVSVNDTNANFLEPSLTTYKNQYNEVLIQYDNIVEDASYQGVNLLKKESLSVRFNENGESKLDIISKDMRSTKLGLNEAQWAEISDIADSVMELRRVISAIRTYVGELGNNYAIVQSRENFTESLINILTEGADKLTLADMNEESANMLSLQTRQQLAVNALSLASQASQSVLKLF